MRVRSPGRRLTGARRRAVTADDLACRASRLAGAVGVGDQGPAQLVQHHVMVPPAVVLQVVQAGPAAVGPVDHVVGLAPGRGLVAAAREIAAFFGSTWQAAIVLPLAGIWKLTMSKRKSNG